MESTNGCFGAVSEMPQPPLSNVNGLLLTLLSAGSTSTLCSSTFSLCGAARIDGSAGRVHESVDADAAVGPLFLNGSKMGVALMQLKGRSCSRARYLFRLV